MDDECSVMIAYRDFLVRENSDMAAFARVLFIEVMIICVIALLV